MAKQKSDKPKATKKAKPVVEPTETTTPEVVTELVAEQSTETAQVAKQEDSMTLKFTFVEAPEKSAVGKYEAVGYRAKLYLYKSFFVDGKLPETVEVSADGFMAPGASAKPKKVLTPEEQAKKDARAAKRAEREANVEVTAQKLRDRLAKLEAKLAKATGAAPAPTEM